MARKHFGRRMAAALAVALVVSMGAAAGTAWAYYTDTNRASGMIAFNYPNPPSTEIEEEKDEDNLSKIISVKNTGEVDAMVRVKIFVPTIDGVTVGIFPVADDGETAIETGSGWTQSVEGNKEGWWYYTSPIVPGAFTSKLKVDVSIDESKDVPAFDIVVVQQCTSTELYTPGGLKLGKFAEGEKRLIGAVAFDDTAAQNQDGE